MSDEPKGWSDLRIIYEKGEPYIHRGDLATYLKVWAMKMDGAPNAGSKGHVIGGALRALAKDLENMQKVKA